MRYKHIKSKKSNSFSLIIVPNTNDIKQLKLANWIPKFIVILIVISLVASGVLLHTYLELKSDYIVKVTDLKTLKYKNQEQKTEIDSLKKKTAEIEVKLESISKLEETVREKVGLENSQATDNQSTSSATSRGGEPTYRANLLLQDHSSTIAEQMDVLSFQLDQSKGDLSDLISDVEERLIYLDAKPNLKPTVGRVTSAFGYRKNPFGGGREFHSGLDLANSTGTPVLAAGSGVVTYSGYNGGYGRVVVISHGYGYQSIYGHNWKISVEVGDKVQKGDQIALMGNSGRSTGPHLHFEIRYYGKAVNPITVIGNNE